MCRRVCRLFRLLSFMSPRRTFLLYAPCNVLKLLVNLSHPYTAIITYVMLFLICPGIILTSGKTIVKSNTLLAWTVHILATNRVGATYWQTRFCKIKIILKIIFVCGISLWLYALLHSCASFSIAGATEPGSKQLRTEVWQEVPGLSLFTFNLPNAKSPTICELRLVESSFLCIKFLSD